ncbi:imelysin family protein [Acidovorax sp.]|uniref:imelysin family protein n=1 Tax=Acidovorax sp. TaxID=1872122 RepID=UPI002ACE7DBD|nr:imelysin family protein [Acidovorax sp.]MDZ7867370.1 imelysin family protein [Acidovorax sp.]
MKTTLLHTTTLAVALIAASPLGVPGVAQAQGTSAQAPQAVTAAAVAAQYATLVHANYEDTLTSAKAMQAAIKAFTAQPSADTLAEARKTWLAAREFYGQTEAFRFYGGPIDDDKGPEGQINAWPMDESYVDSVEGKPQAGLINNRKIAITKKALAAQNERGGEENIATGWHAIEFLLWGQDLSETGPGNRNFEDFVDGKKPNADRRRQYLTVVTELLVDDLSFLVKSWAPEGKSNYRARFAKGNMESVRKMLVGLGSLSRGELAGERLEVAVNSQDQEDEHSCFSDNTHRDAVTNAKGIQNVWLGEYQRADGSMLKGASLRDLVAARNPALADKTSQQIAASVAAAEGIQAPFDREIIGGKDAPGRQRIQKTIDSLTQQSKDLVEAANAIGITKLTLVQP